MRAPALVRTAATYRPTYRPEHHPNSRAATAAHLINYPRSTEMYSMHEALAREHMRQREREAQQHRLASELAAANRWRYLERRAAAASRRHAGRARRLAQHAHAE
jgi:hypothetical protein